MGPSDPSTERLASADPSTERLTSADTLPLAPQAAGEQATPHDSSPTGRPRTLGQATAEHPAVGGASGPRLTAPPSQATAQDIAPGSSSHPTPRLLPDAATPVAAAPATARVTRILPAEHEEALAQVTQAMRALTVVHDDATTSVRAIAKVEEKPTVLLPVTVVAGRKTLIKAPPTLRAPKRRRGGVANLVVALSSLAIVVSVLYAVRPVSGRHIAPQPPQLLAARLAHDPGDVPAGPWDTTAGALALGIGGGAGPGVTAPGSAGLPVKKVATPKPTPPPVQHVPTTPPPPPPPQGIGVSAAPFAPWPPSDPWMAVPGRGAFYMPPVSGFYSSSYGQCTWWAAYERRDENLGGLGNAAAWAWNAPAHGLRTGGAPAPGATVVFQPGVEGAGGGGHVAHVIAVYPGGWFLIAEMNFYWNGGGWGRVDYRFAHSGWGVSFIY